MVNTQLQLTMSLCDYNYIIDNLLDIEYITENILKQNEAEIDRNKIEEIDGKIHFILNRLEIGT